MTISDFLVNKHDKCTMDVHIPYNGIEVSNYESNQLGAILNISKIYNNTHDFSDTKIFGQSMHVTAGTN